MTSSMNQDVANCLERQRKQKIWLMIFACMAMVTVLCVVLILHHIGHAMTVLNCTYEVHTHKPECWNEYSQKYVCGYADYVVHSHDSYCLDESGVIVCELPEHQAHEHSDSCYKLEKTENLICGQEEITVSDGDSEGHTHTDECYETAKTLECGQIELHTHGAECFDGNSVICGEVQLVEHQHDENCMQNIDGFDGIAVALYQNSQNDVTLYQNFQYGDTSFNVKAKYGASAGIPNGAYIDIVRVDKSEYEQIADAAITRVNKHGTKVLEDIQLVFKVRDNSTQTDKTIVLEDDVEIQVELGNKSHPDNYDLVLHGDNLMEVYSFNAEGKLTFRAGKGSTNIDLACCYSLQPGKYGDYTIEYNDKKDAFLTSSYFNSGCALGVAGNFHIVAFNDAKLNTHTNGNVLAYNLYAGSNFGTNGYDKELSYVVNYKSINGNSGTNKDDVALVLGSENVITLTDNGNHFAINNAQLNSPRKIIVDETADAPYIDLAQVKTDITNIAATMAAQENVNIDADLSNGTIKLTSPDAAGYLSIKAGEIGGNDIKLTGFSKGYMGSIIINVDCAGVDMVNMPQRALIYVDGVAQSTNEVTEFSNGKVIWNFINTTSSTKINLQNMTGIVIAPNATVEAHQNLNGTIIAENVIVSAETHRTDFTGTLVPFASQFTAVKRVNGTEPTVDQVFDFTMYQLEGTEWRQIDKAQNVGSNITFSNIEYGADDVGKTYWYMIDEVQGENSEYTYSTEKYVYKVEVSGNGETVTAKTTLYRVTDPDNMFESGTLNLSVLYSTNSQSKELTQADLIFDNYTDQTSISVIKRWLNYDGTAMTENIPDNIRVRLYSATNAEGTEGRNDVTEVTLYKENDWKHTFENLPQHDADNNELYYFVEEISSDAGYTVTYKPTYGIKEGEIEIVNKKNYTKKYTEITVNKQWFDERGQLVDPQTLPEDANITFELYQQVADVVAEGEASESKDEVSADVNAETPAGGSEGTPTEGTPAEGTPAEGTPAEGIEPATDKLIDTYELNGGNNWSKTISNLPLTDYIAVGGEDKEVSYKYYVVEKECSIPTYSVDAAEYENNNTDKGAIVIKNKKTVTEVKIDKRWITVNGGVDSLQHDKNAKPIEITLYSQLGDNEKEEVGTYEIGYDSVEKISGDGVISVNGDQKWSAKIANLPLSEKNADGTDAYYVYTVEEKPVDGYIPTYTGEGYELTITNQSNRTYELPETGSTGTGRIYALGSVIMAMALAGAVMLRRRERH